MASRAPHSTYFEKLQSIIWGPQILAFMPALCLAAYWLLGEGGLIAAALGVPVLWGIVGAPTQNGSRTRAAIEHSGEMHVRFELEHLIARAKPDERGVIFALALDGMEGFADRHGHAVLDDVHTQLTHRLSSILRSGDVVALTDSGTWTIALTPGARLDLETAIQQSVRLQSIVDEPLSVGNTRHYFTAGIGFSLFRNSQASDVPRLLNEAHSALIDAQQAGTGSVRAFSLASDESTEERSKNGTYIVTASSDEITDRIVAWFQPQVSTDTGVVTGFEALARMMDKTRGVMAPGSFLPVLERAGRLEQLGEIMLRQGLEALVSWDQAGLDVETIGVNFSGQDLSNPKLYDKIAWELDRFAVAPHRLTIEVLESVIAVSAEDVITRNVLRLAELGCQIDLDDFGTGHSSISTLRRLPVSRLKIDRSFVARADLDAEQQKMVATILMMADRLGLNSLAEGVETVGEHAILAQLGCRYVQGYGIAKPMPLTETYAWVKDHNSRLNLPPQLQQKSG